MAHTDIEYDAQNLRFHAKYRLCDQRQLFLPFRRQL